MQIFLSSPNEKSTEIARLLQSQLTFTKLADIYAKTEILFDPDLKNTIVECD